MATTRIPGTELPTLEDVQQLVDDVVGSGWWRAHALYDGPVVARECDRKVAFASPLSGERRGREMVWWYEPSVNLPRRPDGAWAWTDWVVIHELAHVGRFRSRGFGRDDSEASHGPKWAGLFLALVAEFIGADQADVLVQAFDHHAVRYAPGRVRAAPGARALEEISS